MNLADVSATTEDVVVTRNAGFEVPIASCEAIVRIFYWRLVFDKEKLSAYRDPSSIADDVALLKSRISWLESKNKAAYRKLGADPTKYDDYDESVRHVRDLELRLRDITRKFESDPLNLTHESESKVISEVAVRYTVSLTEEGKVVVQVWRR